MISRGLPSSSVGQPGTEALSGRQFLTAVDLELLSRAQTWQQSYNVLRANLYESCATIRELDGPLTVRTAQRASRPIFLSVVRRIVRVWGEQSEGWMLLLEPLLACGTLWFLEERVSRLDAEGVTLFDVLPSSELNGSCASSAVASRRDPDSLTEALASLVSLPAGARTAVSCYWRARCALTRARRRDTRRPLADLQEHQDMLWRELRGRLRTLGRTTGIPSTGAYHLELDEIRASVDERDAGVKVGVPAVWRLGQRLTALDAAMPPAITRRASDDRLRVVEF